MGNLKKIGFNIVVAVCCFTGNLLFGQDSFSIENVTIFDGERVTKNASIKVVDGFIAEISAEKMQDGVSPIDGNGKFLMPALSNAHVHAWAPSAQIEAAKAGVLNIMDMAGYEQYQSMMTAFNDSTDYATYYRAGSPATAPEGHGTQFGFPVPTLTQPEEAETFITDRVAAGVDYIKIIVEPWKATLNEPTITALIDAAHENGKMAVAHISKVEDANFVLSNEIDGLVHIWWDSEMDEETMATLTKEKAFFVIPTVLTSVLALEIIRKRSPDASYLSKDQLQSEVKRLFDAGIPILAGTDPPNANINYGTDLYKELQFLSEAGIPNIDVLKAATSNTAKAFKLSNKGFLKKGYRADMILIDGNPIKNIEDIDQIDIVWKKGRKVNRD